MVPRIFCDFNNRVDTRTYSLESSGSRVDLEKLGGAVDGQRAVFYDYDAFEDGEPAWLVADGIIQRDAAYGWVARLEPDGFRWEPRVEDVPPAV